MQDARNPLSAGAFAEPAAVNTGLSAALATEPTAGPSTFTVPEQNSMDCPPAVPLLLMGPGKKEAPAMDLQSMLQMTTCCCA